MATWRNPERLFALCRIAVVNRPGEDRGGLAGAPPGTEHVEEPGLPISATLVRQRAAAGRSVRYLVPDGVADYIAKRGLYR
jgi:nicotinate-nucleotide adenylyltransferase